MCRALSTKVQCAAPRESASSPSAPVPANRSATRSSSKLPSLLASMENSASRTRSAVGRVASPESGTRGRPRHLPLMILTSGSCLQCRAQADHLFARDFPDLALGQVGQFERAIGNPDEARNLQPHELQHPADLAVLAFGQSEEHTSELQSLMRT